MRAKTISKTFRLCKASVEALNALVVSGRAESQTALIEQLISREKAKLDMELEEKELDSAWCAAMQSEEYQAEMTAIEAEFALADAESARRIN